MRAIENDVRLKFRIYPEFNLRFIKEYILSFEKIYKEPKQPVDHLCCAKIRYFLALVSERKR